ncbi:MAG TPA: CocE/NonD family hydrolase [Bryobacteraceae bacterium]|nr:CocE/NonD family hydrolase [Bryobacteraceae bacterium]
MAAAKGLPATLAGFEDCSTFVIFYNEERLGTQDSVWRADGSFESRSLMQVAGQSIEASAKIVPDTEGRWQKMTFQSAIGTRCINRTGTAVTHTFKNANTEKTSTFETEAGAVLFEGNSMALISQALRLYSVEQGGVQKFPVLMESKLAAELSLQAGEQMVRDVDGKKLVLNSFVYGLPGIDIRAWADYTGRLYMVEIPAQNVVFVRVGFERLRVARAPVLQVEVQSGVGVPVRDGIELATDIYRPVGVERAPVILMRTPYKKELNELKARFLARRGYVCAVQDVRGRYSSPGVWEPFVHEANDGYDTIEWLASQPFSNGKVGMIGGSYLGFVQWAAAAEHPPHLATIIPNVSPTDPFYNIPYEYGVFMLWSLWWADVVESEACSDVTGAALRRIADKKYRKLFGSLPVIDLDIAVLGKRNHYWRNWIGHPTFDSYWGPSSFLDKLADVNIPVFHQSGWFDGDGIGTKLNYLRMVSHGHANQKLTLGPWGHTDTATRLIGERDFGENAIIDLQQDYLRWFDYWLRGLDNGVAVEPLVSVFVMGANEWRQGQSYPLENTRFEKLYLAECGTLSFEAPADGLPPDRYRYDPGDPTPALQFYQESEENEKRVRTAEERKQEAREQHVRLAAERSDILVYQTEPLTQPITFAGPLSAVLYASSSARDTDWFVTLSEVDGEGKIFQLTQGRLRGRFRNSLTVPELLAPGEIYEYRIDLWQTGICVPPGARLRVEIASAAFPLFSRNLNTGGHNEVETEYVSAEQVIYHDREHPSHVLLPVIP